MKCERCAFYKIEKSARSRNSNNTCGLINAPKRYYQTCSKFIWNAKYLSINSEKDNYDSNGHVLCRRCGKPLTDDASIARKFGETCYNKRLRQLRLRAKRLF